MTTQLPLRERLEAIFPALDWRGDHHFPHCSAIRYPGSTVEPPDPCTCGGPEVFDALASDTLRTSLARAISGGWSTESIDLELYWTDPVFHAIVYTVRRAFEPVREALNTLVAAPEFPAHDEGCTGEHEGLCPVVQR